MSCEKYKEMISALLDGELSHQEEDALRSHLESCPECSRFAAEMGRFMEMGRSVPSEQMPAALEATILRQTIKSRGARKSLRDYLFGYYRIPRGLAWAAMLAALLLITDAIVKSNLTDTRVDEIAIETTNAEGGVKRIVLSEDDVVSTSTIVKPTLGG